MVTLGARDVSSAVSRGFGRGPKLCRASANTENSHRTREKPLVPRVSLGRSRLFVEACLLRLLLPPPLEGETRGRVRHVARETLTLLLRCSYATLNRF